MKRNVALSHINEKHNRSSSDLDESLLRAFESLIYYLGRHNDLSESDKANFADTAVRAAKAFRDLTATKTEIIEELNQILATGFPRDSGFDCPGAITQGPIEIYGFCPHHLLQVHYHCYVSYLPKVNSNVLGLSKLARIARLLGKRPALQEQLAADIADVLYHTEESELPGITTDGSAVLLIGRHQCMSCRGVHSDALTSVTELRGNFWNNDMEQKFYQAVEAIRKCELR